MQMIDPITESITLKPNRLRFGEEIFYLFHNKREIKNLHKK